jgi:hypothetical protein
LRLESGIKHFPNSFEVWRNRHKAFARTQNHYLQGMISFLNWMERDGRIKFNPLKAVRKVDERGHKHGCGGPSPMRN